MRKFFKFLLVSIFILNVSGAFLAHADDDHKIDVGDINVEDGYTVEAYVRDLTVPTTAAFDGNDLLIAESGFANTAKPRILRVTPSGTVSVVAEEGLLPPVTGILVDNGKIYVSHRGKVSIVGSGGSLTDIVTGLPSDGDHQNNKIVKGRDGRIYLGQGTVTNAGVVGEDNYVFGWLDKHPDIHDVPCKDITLVGANFKSGDPLTNQDDEVETGAYKPFGTTSTAGEVIKGNAKCNGAILSFNPDGSDIKVVAWGMRNPFGLALDNDGNLWTTYHGADVRGSRNIFNDPDYLVKVQQDAWYGWPDYFNGEPVTAHQFDAPGKPKPGLLWQDHPPLAHAFMTFDSHSATNGLAFSPSDAFGFKGQAFIAMFGSFLPVTTGVNIKPEGFSVARLDLATKKVETFMSNKLPGPGYLNGLAGINRPSDVVFGPDNALYVVDWGAAKLTEKGLEMGPKTGVIWRVFPEAQAATRVGGPTRVPEDGIPLEGREPLVRNSSEAYKMTLPQFLWLFLGIILIIVIARWAWKRSR